MLYNCHQQVCNAAGAAFDAVRPANSFELGTAQHSLSRLMSGSSLTLSASNLGCSIFNTPKPLMYVQYGSLAILGCIDE